MKNILALTIFCLFIVNCSKTEEPQPVDISQVSDQKEANALPIQSLEEAELKYESKLEAFRKSKNEKLKIRLSLFKAYKKEAKSYLKRLKLLKNIKEFDKVSIILEEDSKNYNQIKSLLSEYNKKKKDLKLSLSKLALIKKDTNNFNLSIIQSKNLRDPLIEVIKDIELDSRLLKKKFLPEFSQSDLDIMKIRLKNNNNVKSKFNKYFTLKENLSLSYQQLVQVNFDINKDDHTIAALTHESDFFTSLEGHLEAIDKFKIEAKDFINNNDQIKFDAEREQIEGTIISLKDMRLAQRQIKASLREIETLGYEFQTDTLNYNKLKWKSKSVYTNAYSSIKTQWKIGYHIAGLRIKDPQNPTPAESLGLALFPLTADPSNPIYFYKYVNKKTYARFDHIFGTAFTRIVMYMGKYKDQLPKKKERSLQDLGDLLLETYTIVTDYIDSF